MSRWIERGMGGYSRYYQSHPYLTLALTNSALMSIGDVTAQFLTSEFISTFDPERTLRFATFGASVGPVIDRWNKYLEFRFPLPLASRSTSSYTLNELGIKFPNGVVPNAARLERGHAHEKTTSSSDQGSSPWLAVAKRVFADQLFMAPISLLFFLSSMALLEGADYSGIIAKVTDNYFTILSANYMVWPFFQALSFRFVPLRFRVPVGAIAGILWTCFLSLKIENHAVEIEVQS